MKICYLLYAILSYLYFIIEKNGIIVLKALDFFKPEYKVQQKDEKSGFSQELTVSISSLEKKIENVSFKRTYKFK